MRYHLMRQGDDGNPVFVKCFESKAGAEFERIKMEDGSPHKQVYWVETMYSCMHKKSQLSP